MSYLVMARKFRPNNFDEVIGQEHVCRTLQNSITEGRIAHAYLFSGPRGTGKTTMARIFAKALNCKEGPAAHPCGKCDNCKEISAGSSLDVMEIDGASNRGIDEIRDLRENVKFSTANSKYKVYVIDEAHQITDAAFNALLKTLEEPPEHVVFVMATTEEHKVPTTILSRCQRFRFKLLSSKEIAGAIKEIAAKENFEIDDEALNIVVRASGGSMRDALSLLDQAVSSNTGNINGEYMRGLLGLLPRDIIASITENLADGNIQKILKTVQEIAEQGYNILQFARDLRDHLREVMIYSINPQISEISGSDKQLFEKQKTLFTTAKHIRMNNLISKALNDMHYNDQPRIILEMYLLKMSEPYYNVGELINKISELENRVGGGDAVFSNSIAATEPQVRQKTVVSADVDLIDLWQDIVDEIAQKHLTASYLRDGIAKVISSTDIEISFPNDFCCQGALGFQKQITELFKRKTGLDISAKFKTATIPSPEKQVNEVAADEEEKNDLAAVQYEVKEDFKETAKTEPPSNIENIAKKFGGKAKKV
ncbi:MAG: DNA polymerase III subunit gamma/tau [Elusimicrobiota bacterium]|jgi:DNA polymerase-3 subunit gamma/tau|nr:DNA polymerase III subunit gamma/tau [Elusimicrobiota bacterium]